MSRIRRYQSSAFDLENAYAANAGEIERDVIGNIKIHVQTQGVHRPLNVIKVKALDIRV